METRHLIAGIVQQTTVLIAQLSTAAGIRAPLAKVADQVFLNLARELEQQGVGRKVAADMFGLALRSYQLKVSRLAESASERERTLWEAVLDALRSGPGATRKQLMKRFAKDSEADVAAVLQDLVHSGLASRTGRGASAFYQVASDQAVAALANEEAHDAITNFVWLAIFDREQATRTQLIAELAFDEALILKAVESLLREGRIGQSGELLSCRKLTIPVGAEQGWEVAVLDHFRAVATAIAGKLEARGAHSAHGDVQGGSTLTFSLSEGHPYEREVYGLLQRVRADLHPLWERVSAHNEAHPIAADERSEVTFYFGQSVVQAKARVQGEKP
jgi:hypothetical protein